MIPLFELHRDVLETLVEPMDVSVAKNTLRQILFSYPGIQNLEKTNATDRLGKWFVVVERARKNKMYHFIDEILPETFRSLQVMELKNLGFDHFPS